jgi:hypothetical protein
LPYLERHTGWIGAAFEERRDRFANQRRTHPLIRILADALRAGQQQTGAADANVPVGTDDGF